MAQTQGPQGQKKQHFSSPKPATSSRFDILADIGEDIGSSNTRNSFKKKATTTEWRRKEDKGNDNEKAKEVMNE